MGRRGYFTKKLWEGSKKKIKIFLQNRERQVMRSKAGEIVQE